MTRIIFHWRIGKLTLISPSFSNFPQIDVYHIEWLNLCNKLFIKHNLLPVRNCLVRAQQKQIIFYHNIHINKNWSIKILASRNPFKNYSFKLDQEVHKRFWIRWIPPVLDGDDVTLISIVFGSFIGISLWTMEHIQPSNVKRAKILHNKMSAFNVSLVLLDDHIRS